MTSFFRNLALIVLATQLTFCGDSQEDQPVPQADTPSTAETVKTRDPSKNPQSQQSQTAEVNESKLDFTDYCHSPQSLEESQTLLALFDATNTDTCEELNQDLHERKYLSLQDKALGSLMPLTFFTNLSYLNLQNSNVQNIAPLKQLKNLVYLNLNGNQLSTLDGLTGLEGLHYLYVDGNPINETDLSSSSLYAFKAPNQPTKRLQPHAVGEREKASAFLVSDNQMCTGRWLYAPFKSCTHQSHGVASYKSKSSKVCGVAKVNEIPKSCRHKAHGLENRDPIVKDRKHTIGNSHGECTNFKNEMTRNLTKTYSASEYHINVQSDYNPARTFGRDHTIAPSRCTVAWEVKIYQKKTSRSCGVTKQPIYKSCRHASHGEEAFNKKATAVCGTAEPVLSDIKQLKETIAARGVPTVCTTCSNLPIHDEDSAHKKFGCLWNNLQMTGLTHPERNEMIMALKLMAKSYGHFLTAEQVSQIIELHLQNPQIAYDVESNLD